MPRGVARAVAVLAIAVAVAGALWKAYDLGHKAGTAKMTAVLAEWKLAVAEQAERRRKDQAERIAALESELDELRSRPEQVRIVTRTVRLKPDARCDSLPADFKRLWDAGYESGVRMVAATAAAGMDDASRVALADAARVIEEAKHRFEINAARLTALQLYVGSVLAPPDE